MLREGRLNCDFPALSRFKLLLTWIYFNMLMLRGYKGRNTKNNDNLGEPAYKRGVQGVEHVCVHTHAYTGM